MKLGKVLIKKKPRWQQEEQERKYRSKDYLSIIMQQVSNRA